MRAEPTTRREEAAPRRRGLWGFVSRHRRAVAAAVTAGLGLAIFLLLWFQPWKLFLDVTVNEELPGTVAAPSLVQPPAEPGGAEPAQPAAPAGPAVLSTGAFRDLEHDTNGVAKIVRLANGSLVVRLEGFRTSNGPDVVVILSDTPATEDSWGAYDDGEFVNIGALKGNIGNQNLRVPSDVDVSKYRSVVIWCRRFNVAFGAAPIEL